MRITELRGENFKRLVAVLIKADGGVVTIGGDNGAGKTSVLDSIAVAIGGKQLCPDEPLRHGADKGFVEVALDEGLTVRRSFNKVGTSLTVTSADGLRYPSPQAILDKLVTTLTFDPLAFARAKQAEQVATLRQLGGVDTKELDQRRAALYDTRTDVSREARRLAGALEKMPAPEGEPPKQVDVAELAAEFEARRATNAAKGAKARALEHAKAEGKRLVSELDELRSRVTQAEKRIDVQRGVVARLKEELAAAPDADEGAMLEQIRSAEAINARARAAGERAKLVAEQEAAVDHAERLTQQIAQIDEQKAKALAEAKLPVPGLTFDDSGVRLDGVPFAQASAAQQIRASAAIGLALNPKLRVLLIRDGSLLDSKSMAALEQIAEQHDAQIWLERVGDACATVVIEDGHVAGAEQETSAEDREERERAWREKQKAKSA